MTPFATYPYWVDTKKLLPIFGLSRDRVNQMIWQGAPIQRRYIGMKPLYNVDSINTALAEWPHKFQKAQPITGRPLWVTQKMLEQFFSVSRATVLRAIENGAPIVQQDAIDLDTRTGRAPRPHYDARSVSAWLMQLPDRPPNAL